jgi:L-lactate dehydrogenase (cytochrome)/glycolate oxidase
LSKVKVKRRIPSPKDLAQLLRFRKFIFNPTSRRLAKALTIYNLRNIAKRRTPQAPFDYTDGGADTESSLSRARLAYERIEFQPNILKDVKTVDLSVKMLGKVMKMPLGIAPTGFTRMMQTEGEYAGACAASDAGIPYTLSTMGTRSIEDVAKAAQEGRNWFQLYMWKD